MDNQEYIRQRLVQIKKIVTKDKNGETFSTKWYLLGGEEYETLLPIL